jgi:hypothetical protein
MYYGNISTASNRADWMEVVVLTDEDTGDAIDISACRITVTVKKLERQPNFYGAGFYYDYPVQYGGITLTGSTDDGTITMPDVGTFQWEFDETRMNGLPPGEYLIGVRISQDGRTMQLIAGTVIIFEGIDMQ